MGGVSETVKIILNLYSFVICAIFGYFYYKSKFISRPEDIIVPDNINAEIRDIDKDLSMSEICYLDVYKINSKRKFLKLMYLYDGINTVSYFGIENIIRANLVQLFIKKWARKYTKEGKVFIAFQQIGMQELNFEEQYFFDEFVKYSNSHIVEFKKIDSIIKKIIKDMFNTSKSFCAKGDIYNGYVEMHRYKYLMTNYILTFVATLIFIIHCFSLFIYRDIVSIISLLLLVYFIKAFWNMTDASPFSQEGINEKAKVLSVKKYVKDFSSQADIYKKKVIWKDFIIYGTLFGCLDTKDIEDMIDLYLDFDEKIINPKVSTEEYKNKEYDFLNNLNNTMNG